MQALSNQFRSLRGLRRVIGTFIFFIIVVRPPPALAASEFTTSFHSLYTIASDGETSVTHTITLKNNLAYVYATNYSLATSGDHLSQITARDDSGPIGLTTTVQNGLTTIHLEITRPSIGKDQEKILTLSYRTDDVVEKLGQTTTVNIPRLSRANEAQDYTRVVKIEGVQDLPQLIYPPQSKTEPDGAYTIYTFYAHQADSLTLLFGDSVTYRLSLTYELKNKELTALDSELALPPDTPYQHILLDSITPPPLDIHLDQDGNWLARYHLKSQDTLLVKAVLFATIYPRPILPDPSSRALPKTSHSIYWDTGASSVQDLSSQLKTPANIYTYLVSNFTYNYSVLSGTPKRLGTVQALASPGGVLCTEFTDTFVTLARSLKIPSREINGYGYTKNRALQPQNDETDILHAWPEFYSQDQDTWIQVDPTWGNTTGGIDYFNKLDFSHITFVRHGQEDSYPLPAGAYKTNPADKYVQVEIAQDIPQVDSSSKTVGDLIYNTGNVALINDTVGYLPPYGSFSSPDNRILSLYDKIKLLCERLLSKLWQLRRVFTPPSTS